MSQKMNMYTLFWTCYIFCSMINWQKIVSHALSCMHQRSGTCTTLRRPHKHLQLACADLRTRNANKVSTQTRREHMIVDCWETRLRRRLQDNCESIQQLCFWAPRTIRYSLLSVSPTQFCLMCIESTSRSGLARFAFDAHSVDVHWTKCSVNATNSHSIHIEC